jgi:hypothetical protein
MTPCAWSDDALHTLQASVDASPWGPLATPLESYQGAYLFRHEHQGAAALVAVRPVQYRAGMRLDVVGLASEGAGPLSPMAMHAAIEQLARELGADLLAMTTAKPGLVKSCMRAGWLTTGAVMLKHVRLQ